jgi:hypothetical protein
MPMFLSALVSAYQKALRTNTTLRRKQGLVENQTASLLTTWTTVRAAFQSVSPGTATG